MQSHGRQPADARTTWDDHLFDEKFVHLAGEVRGFSVILVSQRRLWIDVVKRFVSDITNKLEISSKTLESIQLFIVDASLTLQMDVKRLKLLDGKVLVYGGFLHSSRVLELFANSVDGYLPEHTHRSEFVKAIDCLDDGVPVAPFQLPIGEPIRQVVLTAAEERAARRYFFHLETSSRSQVALDLGISEKTLSNQLWTICRKVGAAKGESRVSVARRISGSGLLGDNIREQET